MIIKSKICGVSDSKTLNFIVNHNYPAQFIGFIVNYTNSKRYVNIKNLKELLKIDKKNGTIIYPKHVHKALRKHLGIENSLVEKDLEFSNTEDFNFFV